MLQIFDAGLPPLFDAGLLPLFDAGLLSLFNAGLLPHLLASFTEEEARALRCTCRLARDLSRSNMLPCGFSYRTDAYYLEQACKRIRVHVNFGSAHEPWSAGRYWQSALVLFTEFLYSVRADGVLRVRVEHGEGFLGWKSFRVVDGKELDWHQRVLGFAANTSVLCHAVMERYKYSRETPTRAVFQLLTDLGFQPASSDMMPPAATLTRPQRRKLLCDMTFRREWLFSGTAEFSETIQREHREIERKKALFDVFTAAGADPKRARTGPT
ncbi:MAG: hypothetical protein EBR09_16700 [Proteobacteria bacterium]|nr:hypothetical protein [Pseudomonadota bacterium]